MKVVGIIPSRWESSRFPGKSLAKIGGKPLIQWVWERASLANRLESVWVATDDKRIEDVVKGFGGNVVMTRTDHPSGTDRIAEAVQKSNASIVFNIQGDEPLIEPELIDELATLMMRDRHCQMATAASRIENDRELADPSVVKVVLSEAGKALYFSRAVIPHVRERQAGRLHQHCDFLRHVGLYGYRAEFLKQFVQTAPCAMEKMEKLEQLRALYMGADIRVTVVDSVAPGVDTPADAVRVEKIMRNRGLI
jgi:3-deoxy-manno-octulosonate cytidylyltransferase (CMP-KDO synthetase)